jgi:hypothetical protein
MWAFPLIAATLTDRKRRLESGTRGAGIGLSVRMNAIRLILCGVRLL